MSFFFLRIQKASHQARTTMTNGEVEPAPAPANPAAPAENDNHDDDAEADALPHDEEASYCSTTSEESLAHSDEDDDDDEAGEAGDTIASPSRTSSARRTVRTPSFSYDDLARRPRSNPRTRFPLRNPSPLLQDLRREQHVAASAETANAARNVSGTQSPQIRAAPQDAGSAATNANGSSTVNSTVSSPQPQPQQQRVTIRLAPACPSARSPPLQPLPQLGHLPPPKPPPDGMPIKPPPSDPRSRDPPAAKSVAGPTIPCAR